MRRQEYITFLGSTLVCPISVRTQHPGRVYRVAWIGTTSPLYELVGPTPVHPQARAFLQGLREQDTLKERICRSSGGQRKGDNSAVGPE